MARIELTVSRIESHLDRLGYQRDRRPGALGVLGVRSATPAGDAALASCTPTPDRYDDTILVFGRRAGGAAVLRLFLASVDPGAWWTAHPSPSRGCAHLLDGQYRYRLGVHNLSKPAWRRYPALVPEGQVKVWRDANRNAVRDGQDFVETGFYPINIHAGGTAPRVDRESAGCQILHGGRDGAPYRAFLALLRQSTADRYWYTLLEASDLLEPAPVDPAALPPARRAALQAVLDGLARLYADHQQAALPPEDGVTFGQLLNRLRHVGPLRAFRPGPVTRPAATTVEAARQGLLEGFRQIYGHLVDAGLDHRFHSQLNQLRQFGPLAGC